MDRIPRDALIVSDEQVNCPLRRATCDVEACWRCPWLRGEGAVPQGRYIRCAPPSRTLLTVGLGPSSS